jgi:hypothetical protein
MTRYALDRTIEIAASAGQILPWLEEPELMQRWMGVGSIATTDGGIQVEILHGGYAGWTYFGTVIERGEDRLVRRYRLAGSEDDYDRTVTYQLDPRGRVRLSVDTEIQGLNERAARIGAEAEKRALSRALDRLRDAVEGRGPGLLGRLRGARGSAGPL